MHILRVHRVFFAKSLDLGLISTDKSPRTRAKIIAELASLPSAIQEKICEDKKRLANGATAVYHNLQYWANGRNHTVRIPKNKLPATAKDARRTTRRRSSASWPTVPGCRCERNACSAPSFPHRLRRPLVPPTKQLALFGLIYALATVLNDILTPDDGHGLGNRIRFSAQHGRGSCGAQAKTAVMTFIISWQRPSPVERSSPGRC